MNKKELLAHKLHPKTLTATIAFKPLKRKTLPRPFKGFGGARVHSTGMLEVSGEHQAMMLWRDGENLTDTAFYGYLLCVLPSGDLYPIIEYHWHPSHKAQHVKMPCETSLDYNNRLLMKAPELSCKPQIRQRPDPRNESDLNSLVVHFCAIAGIMISSNKEDPYTQDLI